VTFFIDNRGGSSNLRYHLQGRVPVEMGRFDGDFEFLGSGPDDQPIAIGGEYKKISECATAMTDGRLTGTQIARMCQSYQRVYLVIEGRTRVGSDGTLEYYVRTEKRKEVWYTVYGRSGSAGFMAREFYSRLESMSEFAGVRVILTENIYETSYRLEQLYRYWTRPYSSHKSYSQWDQSKTGRQPGNLLLPTSDLPLATRWARELAGIGQHKAHFVGAHFQTGANLVLATESDWAGVEVRERVRTGPNAGRMRSKRLSTETIQKIMREIWTIKGGN
jgi:ERCC4-type nuclease